jgi:hypothetical protein
MNFTIAKLVVGQALSPDATTFPEPVILPKIESIGR